MGSRWTAIYTTLSSSAQVWDEPAAKSSADACVAFNANTASDASKSQQERGKRSSDIVSAILPPRRLRSPGIWSVRAESLQTRNAQKPLQTSVLTLKRLHIPRQLRRRSA